MLANVRDAFGRVTNTIHRSISGRYLTVRQVHSLGYCIDRYLDLFGYESAIIDILYDAHLSSTTLEEFIFAVNDWIPLSEAEWYFEFIDIPRNHATRSRLLPYIEVGEEVSL